MNIGRLFLAGAVSTCLWAGACFAATDEIRVTVYEGLIEKSLKTGWDLVIRTDSKDKVHRVMVSVLDIDEVLANIRAEGLELLANTFDAKELHYLESQVSNAAVQKFNELLLQGKNPQQALASLSGDERQALLLLRDDELEAILMPKYRQVLQWMQVRLVENFVQQMADKEAAVDEIAGIAELCQFAIALDNSALPGEQVEAARYLYCGAGHKIGNLESSKQFARLVWQGSFLPRDIPRALSIYSVVLNSSREHESRFYYGALAFNHFEDAAQKRAAACWIRLAALAGNPMAVEFFKDIENDYPDLPGKCALI